MTVRVPLDPKKFGDVLGAMLGLNKVIESAGLDKKLLYLVEVRVSQLNGCGFCIDMHTKDARAGGETEQRLYLVQVWREAASMYSERERAALAWAEAVTKLGEQREWPYPATVIDPHVRSILPDPSNPKLIFASIQIGGVIWSEDEGKTWTDSVEGIDPDVHWLDLNPQTSEMYATTGGGAHWTYPASPQPHWGKAVYKSIDRGRTWTSLTDDLAWDYGEPMRHHPTDGAMLYVGVARGVPTRKTEADAQWYPFVIVTKPDEGSKPCPSASRPIVPSNARWRRCCTFAPPAIKNSTSTR